MPVLPSLNSIKSGMTIVHNNEPYLVVQANFVRMQAQKPVMQTKMKSLLTGKVLEYSFKPGDKVEEADIERQKASYLYSDETGSHFMDSQNYDQFSLDKKIIQDKIHFLKDGSEIIVLKFKGNPMGIQLPIKMEFKVTEADPGVKGDTAQGKVTKPITIETGFSLNAPLFIKVGDVVRVNTDTGEYVERA